MTSNKIKQFLKIPPFESLILLVFIFSINFCFGQNKIITKIKSYNEEANYRLSVKQIKKYQDKKYDTLNYNYLIALADYYCIPKNNEYSPYKAISIVKDINCEKITPEISGIYFKDKQDCNLVLKNLVDKYVGLYFEIVYKSNNLDSLKSFYTDFKSYTEYKDKIYQKIALIRFNNAKQSNSKSELLEFQIEFANTPFASEATALIEEIDYESATSANTIESYTGFLKNYPQTNKRNTIQSKLEALKWQECVTINTKKSYQSFINEFPNSTKMPEAKMMLRKFVDVFNLKVMNSFTTISNEKQMFQPFEISNGRIGHPELTLLKIGQNGEIALAVRRSDNIGRLIDLTDGAIIFEFPYLSFSNYFFNSDDSKLFFYDNKFIKQIDLKSFEITNLVEIESNAYNFQYMCLEKNTIHFCQDKYESRRKKFLHYTYDLTTAKKDLEVFYEFDYPVRGDIQYEFSALPGNAEEKLLKLKLMYGDKIKIKQLTKNSSNEYLLLDFPYIYVIKNGVFTFASRISIKETDRVTNELKNKYLDLDRKYNKVQLTNNNRIVFTARQSLFMLQLGTEDGFFPNNQITVTHVDPFEIKTSTNDGFMFAQLDEKTNNLYYQIDIGYGCDYDDDNEIYVYNYSNLFSPSKKGIQGIVKNKLEEIDKSLGSLYNANINSEAIKNQPLESDDEKYHRVRNIYLKMNPTFNKIQDSLFYSLNEIVKDSIKTVTYDPLNVFITSNYNVDDEFWRLAIKNPFNGKNISLIYDQSKADAKLNLYNNFSNILLEVKYYFNLISLTYEPILVSITNKQSKKSDKFIIPYKDGSLLKNLYLTDNSFMDNKYLDCRLERGDIYYDDYILRYFVHNGKPKYYFNYGFADPAQSNKPGVSIRNLDDSNINFTFQNEFINCCPPPTEVYREFPGGNYREYLRFDDIPYFINKSVSSYVDVTSIYELNKTARLGSIDGVLYKGQSYLPNSWVIKENIVEDYNKYGSLLITAANLEIIDSRLSTAIKTFNIIELGGYSGSIFSVDYDASFSPNGKYFAVRCNTKTYLYETRNWTNVVNFDNTSGKLYWDCNSYYLGVGNDLIPVLLLGFWN